MSENWIEFGERPKQAARGEIYASINYKGDIVLNRKAFEELKRPEAVVFLFNPDNDTIGLRTASRATLNAHPVKPKGDCGHRFVSAVALARKHDIRIDGTARFRTAEVKDGILRLDLRNLTKVTGTPRKGGRKRTR